MITYQANYFPALEVDPKPLVAERVPTLTEFATLAIYGAALTAHEFCLARDEVISSERAVWGVENGPSTMHGLLNALTMPEPVSNSDLAAPMVYGNLDRARTWLADRRHEPIARALTRRCAEQKSLLIRLEDDEVSTYAAAEAALIAADEAIIDSRARKFYRLLGRLLISRQVILKGRLEYNRPSVHLPNLPSERVALTDDNLCDVLSHHPETNDLDINPHHTTAADLEEEQLKRQKEGVFYRIFHSDRSRTFFSDLRIPNPDHVQILLNAISGDEGPATVARSVSTTDVSPLPVVKQPGKYEKDDAPLRSEIVKMVTLGSAATVDDAARQLAFAGRIVGKGTLENKATRLAKQVLEVRPDLSTRKKSVE